MIEKTEDVFAALRDPATEAATNSRRAGDGTIDRIAKELRTTINTVRRQLMKLRKQGRAHIIGWTESSPRAPIWAAGAGEDAPKPVCQDSTQRRAYQRKYRDAAKAKAAGLSVDDSTGSSLRRIDDYLDKVRAAGPRSWCAALELA